MAFQITAYQLHQYLKRLVASRDNNPNVKFGDWLDSITQDPKEKDKFRAAFIAADLCLKKGRDVTRVSKVICWRDPEGKPGEVQVEF